MEAADWSVVSSSVSWLACVWELWSLACESFLIPSFDKIINTLYDLASKNSRINLFRSGLFNWITFDLALHYL